MSQPLRGSAVALCADQASGKLATRLSYESRQQLREVTRRRFHALVEPDSVAAPSMLAWNNDLAIELGLDLLAEDEAELARIFSGASQFAGVQPIALAYAGHQFGHFVPLLGDGRAALLGEVVTDAGKRYDIQLKGSGRTPYSRDRRVGTSRICMARRRFHAGCLESLACRYV